MSNLLKELIFETLILEGNKPPKDIIKGRTYKCIVRLSANKKFKKTIKKNYDNKKYVKVKMVVPDGKADFSIIKFDKKKYMVKTSSLK